MDQGPEPSAGTRTERVPRDDGRVGLVHGRLVMDKRKGQSNDQNSAL